MTLVQPWERFWGSQPRSGNAFFFKKKNSKPSKMAARHVIPFSLRPQWLQKTQPWNYCIPSETRFSVPRISRTNSTMTKKSTSRTNTRTDHRPPITASKSKRSKKTDLRRCVIQFCKDAQKRRPYVFQLCTSLAIWFSADVIAQQIGDTEYDAAQTGRMLIIGGSASIPIYKW